MAFIEMDFASGGGGGNSEIIALIPAMTNYTTPSGEVLYNSANNPSNELAYYAFNGNDTSQGCNGNALEWYVGYDFKKDVYIKNVFLITRTNFKQNSGNVLQIKKGGSWGNVSGVDISTISASNTCFSYPINEKCTAIRVYNASGSDYNGFKVIQAFGYEV